MTKAPYICYGAWWGEQLSQQMFQKNVHAAEDLLQIVTDSHVIAAAATAQKIPSASSVTLPDEGIAHLARTCLDRFLRPIFFHRDNLSEDAVHTYACKIMLLGLLWYAFQDSIHEGDRSAVMSLWKVLTVIFQLTGHRRKWVSVVLVFIYCAIYKVHRCDFIDILLWKFYGIFTSFLFALVGMPMKIWWWPYRKNISSARGCASNLSGVILLIPMAEKDITFPWTCT